jgi:hypothetical protein
MNFIGIQGFVNRLAPLGALFGVADPMSSIPVSYNNFASKWGLGLSLDLETTTLLCRIYFWSIANG